MDVTLVGTIIEVKKIIGGVAGPSVKIIVEDRKGSCSEVWIFADDLSSFNDTWELGNEPANTYVITRIE